MFLGALFCDPRALIFPQRTIPKNPHHKPPQTRKNHPKLRQHPHPKPIQRKIQPNNPTPNHLQQNNQPILSLTYYILIEQAAIQHAQTWLEGNYIKQLYPNINLHSQRISETLTQIGDEHLNEHSSSSLLGGDWVYDAFACGAGAFLRFGR